jgi:dipeptidyl aminopeptidase/acylaminoacyl peptidase
MGFLKRYIENYSIYIFTFLFLALLIGYSSLAVAQNNDKKEIQLVQNLNALGNSNGKIIQQKQIQIESEYSDKVKCYKIKYKSDGFDVVGFVLIPQSVGSKFPVIIFNRGGYRDVDKISEQHALKYLFYLSSQNYVVLGSQYRGSDDGQGEDEFGGKDVNDVLNLIPLAKSLPFADSDKIVMLGFFRGGMMTYLAIKEGAPIKAAAVVGGISNLIQWETDRPSVGEEVLKQLINPPTAEEYKKRSAVYWPEKINVPVLIIHGEYDSKVSVNQAEGFANSLKQNGKIYELAIFKRDDRWVSLHREERNHMIFDWFGKYLQ